MTAQQFAALCVPTNLTLREALTTLDQTGRGVLMVVGDDGRLQRTLTDGDMRRAALAHVPESACISELPGNPPLTLADIVRGLTIALEVSAAALVNDRRRP